MSSEDRSRNASEEPGSPDGHPGLPTWAKILAAGAIVGLVVLLLAMLLLGGEHGPGMHG